MEKVLEYWCTGEMGLWSAGVKAETLLPVHRDSNAPRPCHNSVKQIIVELNDLGGNGNA